MQKSNFWLDGTLAHWQSAFGEGLDSWLFGVAGSQPCSVAQGWDVNSKERWQFSLPDLLHLRLGRNAGV